MFTLKDFKVTLKNPKEVKEFVKKHGEFAAVCYNTDTKYAEKVGESCLQSGHLSGSRHLYMVFELKNIPRSAVDQIVRTTQGFVTNVQSLRYCNKDGKINIYIDEKILENSNSIKAIENVEDMTQTVYSHMQYYLRDNGYTNEQVNEIARTIIPIGVATECNISVNLECLMHLANIRLCNRAELPIRTIVEKMVEQVVKIEPRYKPFLVPNCVKFGKCVEGKHCCKKFDEVMAKYEK